MCVFAYMPHHQHQCEFYERRELVYLVHTISSELIESIDVSEVISYW